ncbi:hypothetical protein [Psychrobacter jeotgali]|uniref:hypothetical protein n=1 Tax=Psychrobacter jeotgali TaxID=179010 RepID=UPI00191A323F|nr:hypothetical protein [Psychrobacter jeotgali]
MRIGYYAHHHGSGHCRQADKLVALLPLALRAQLTVFTSLNKEAYQFEALDELQIVRLSPEDERMDEVLPGRSGEYWQPKSLHYSPVGNSDIQTRSWQILDAIKRRNIDLMIIDVSAEVAMLCRVASIPFLYVRLAGIRDDTAHLDAFAGALGLLAPYPKSLETPLTPDWVQQKTFYLDFLPSKAVTPISYQDFIKSLKVLASSTNGISNTTETCPRLDQLASMQNSAQSSAQFANSKDKPLLVTVIKGYGGHEAIDTKLPNLRRALPNAFIISLGPISDAMRAYVDIATEVADVTPFIIHNELLLMACGMNSVAQVYYHSTPLIALPADRPHQEQQVLAEALIGQGRALSWEQFINLSLAGSSDTTINNESVIYQNIIAALSSNHETDDNKNADNPLIAQDFMNNLISYSRVKHWFQDWLLPRLEITPERMKW